MSNIKLQGHNWATNGIYDTIKNKTQAEINADLYSGLSLYDWKSIVSTVRNGGTIPNGTVFTVEHSKYGLLEFVTRRMNVDKVYNDSSKPTVTIQTKYALPTTGTTSFSAAGFQFDRPEAFHEPLESAISAGTVCKFGTNTANSWTYGTYYFTATSGIPEGAVLCISGATNTALTSLYVDVYTSQRATSVYIQYPISSGDGGATVNLGHMGSTCNYSQRVAYGSNNFAQSNIMTWLNTNSGNNMMNTAWTPQTKYDMMDTTFTSRPGFLGGFPPDFLQALQTCAVHNIATSAYETGDYQVFTDYTVNCKFWLPSRKEIYGTDENEFTDDEETQFPYYATVATENADKLLYAKGASSPSYYWLRTPRAITGHYVDACNPNTGAMSYYTTQNKIAIAPVAILG